MPIDYEQMLKRNTERRKRLKAAVYVLLGQKCARCGFDDPRALQIDHINGGGKRDLQKIVNGQHCRYTFHKRILANPNAQNEYQILCANCNWIKRWENHE